MSEAAKKWCSDKGLILPFEKSHDFVVPKEGLTAARRKKWESMCSAEVWRMRKSWFKKPLAMLQTPFQKNVWMALDCEVCQPIDAIFNEIGSNTLGAVKVGKRHYTSGVIVYDKKASLLKAWAEACLTKHCSCIKAEEVLTQLICKNKYPFKELGEEFNWLMGWGYNLHLKIAHWACSWGKLCIETMGGIHVALSK